MEKKSKISLGLIQLQNILSEVVEVPGESQNVTIDRNILTVVFPEHVMGRGGMVTLRVPRYIFVDCRCRLGMEISLC
eukprot:s1521_g16.t1